MTPLSIRGPTFAMATGRLSCEPSDQDSDRNDDRLELLID